MSPPATVRALALMVAFGVDRCFGEPPARFHPVVWIGSALSATGAPWAQRSPRSAFARGVVAWLVGATLSVAAAWLAQRAITTTLGDATRVALLAQALLIGLLLKLLLAWRMLREEVVAVEAALGVSLEAGRAQLRRLVSRDTSALSTTQVRESALESLAENLNDSLVAPLFWFVIGGLPGAALYRFANTADAMWGYRGVWEWAGKWAARADDLLCYLPARLTALLLALASWRSPAGLARVARVTPSPNGGWPMGMLALALNVRLSKPAVYVLNPAGAEAQARHLWDGLRVCERAAWLAVVLCGASLLAAERGW